MNLIINNKRLVFISLMLPVLFFYYDEIIVLWLRDFNKSYNMDSYPFFKSLDIIVKFIGHGTTLIIFSMLLYILGKYINKKLSDTGKVLFFSLITSGIIAQILKHLVGRERPWSTDSLVLIGPSLKKGYDSFPSGHTTLAFCFAFIFSQKYPKLKVPLYMVAIIVGLQRFEAIEHFPSDILGGAIVGMLAAKLISDKLRHNDKLAVSEK